MNMGAYSSRNSNNHHKINVWWKLPLKHSTCQCTNATNPSLHAIPKQNANQSIN